MKYHKYKHKKGGYYRGRTRSGHYYTRQEGGCGSCCGCCALYSLLLVATVILLGITAAVTSRHLVLGKRYETG